jgi:uncharacterized protein
MTTYPALPADGLLARWAGASGEVTESATLRWENEAWTVECVLSQHQAQAVMRVSASWQVRQLLLFRDLPEPDLWLANDGGGRWGEVNGAHRDDLDGCTEVVVADSVSSHVPTLRRLPLLVGHSADMRVATIDPDTLSVTPTTWRFHRTGEHRWEVQRPDASHPVTYEVDRFGLPLDVGIDRRRVLAAEA